MTPELLTALFTFALVTVITPGPNNLMLMASGANFGLKRSLPHMLGIGVGFVVMLLGVGAGLVRAFDALPWLHLGLTVASSVYLFWLAWRIATSTAPKGESVTGTPLTFLQAAAFQWVNPKAWAMALTAVTAYAPDQSLASVALVAVVFGAINLPCVSSWTLLGREIRRWLSSPGRLRLFNYTMAALLVLSMLPFLIG